VTRVVAQPAKAAFSCAPSSSRSRRRCTAAAAAAATAAKKCASRWRGGATLLLIFSGAPVVLRFWLSMLATELHLHPQGRWNNTAIAITPGLLQRSMRSQTSFFHSLHLFPGTESVYYQHCLDCDDWQVELSVKIVSQIQAALGKEACTNVSYMFQLLTEHAAVTQLT
jgi:hypothetical protein